MRHDGNAPLDAAGGVEVLIAGPVILYYMLLSRPGLPAAVVSGVISLMVIKHLGLLPVLLGPLYALFRRATSAVKDGDRVSAQLSRANQPWISLLSSMLRPSRDRVAVESDPSTPAICGSVLLKGLVARVEPQNSPDDPSQNISENRSG